MKTEFLSGSNIVSLQSAGSSSASVKRSSAKLPAISMVEAYWEGLRDVRTMPARAEINPRGIGEALEFAFILEKIAPGHARIRLAGNHLNDLLGMEVRGMPLTSLFLPEARLEIQKILENVFTSPASVCLKLSSDKGFSRPNLEAQMYLAPMKDQKGAPTRILGALQSIGKIGCSPRRFSVASFDVNTLTGMGNVVAAPMDTRKQGYEAKIARFEMETAKPKANNSAAIPHLRLVTNNDA